MKFLSVSEDDKGKNPTYEPGDSKRGVGDDGERQGNWSWRGLSRRGLVALVIGLLALSASVHVHAQDALPFEVSNPKHLEWSTDEAGRIYSSACELVARSVRPERPPRLTPKFRLVLGTKEDETLHTGTTSEVHLKTWNPAHFAEAMVLMASREILKSEDVLHLTRDTLRAAEATVSVNDLKKTK